MRRPKRYFYVKISVLFGTFLSAWVAVTSPVLVELLGLELLTSAFGTLTFVRGCAALLGFQFLNRIVGITSLRKKVYIMFNTVVVIHLIQWRRLFISILISNCRNSYTYIEKFSINRFSLFYCKLLIYKILFGDQSIINKSRLHCLI